MFLFLTLAFCIKFMYYWINKHKRGNMTNSEQKLSAQSASRKPRVSTAIDRKMVTRPVRSQSMIARNAEMVVNRSSTQSGQQMKQQMQQQSNQQQTTQKQMMSSQQQTQQSQQQSQQQMKQQMMQEKLMQVTNQRMQQRMSSQQQTEVMKETAKQMKESAIEKALASASRTQIEEKKSTGVHFGFKRVLLAMAGAALGVFAIVYFVNLNAPNISLKVAAMQTGIEASYPAFVPRDYTLSDITSEVGKISLNFKNVTTDSYFTIIEEKSSWDSNALLNNYVRYEYGEDYTTLREQGLTLYVSNSSAAWVNGGIVYKLLAPANTLTKKQIKSIAVSL